MIWDLVHLNDGRNHPKDRKKDTCMDAIEVNNLSFSYDQEKDVLKNISFSIPQGSYTTIIGHNGSGKSTIAKLLIGLLEPKEGEIRVLGTTLTDDNLYEQREHLGIVFQNPDNQFIGSTVADDIAFGLENHCVPHEDMQPIIEESARRVGMLEYLDAEPTNLSGGQKQRVAIAGLLATSPDIIIFDESTSMLDPQGKSQINEQIRRLNEEEDKTIISITHDMNEVAQSEYVIVLKDGQVVRTGTPWEVFSDEKLMESVRLDIPFGLKLSKKLKEQGLLEQTTLSIDEAVKSLCPSR